MSAASTGGGGGGSTTTAPPSSGGATDGPDESVAHKLHLPWWPQGDPGKLRDAARAYRAAATALTDAAQAAGRGISDVTGSNTGSAIDAMGARWGSVYYAQLGLDAPSDGAPALDNAIGACLMLAQACEDYAGHIEDARHRLEELAAELVAGLVVGGLLTFVTAGLSDAAAAANAARVVTAALELADTVGSFVTVAFRVGGLAIQGALVGAGSDLAMQSVRMTVNPQESFSFSELGQSATFGAVLNPGLAGAGVALGKAAPLARNLGTRLDDLTGIGTRVGTGMEKLNGARTTVGQRLGALSGDERGSISVDMATLGVTRFPEWLQRMFKGTAWHREQQALLVAEDPAWVPELRVLKPVAADGTRPKGQNVVDLYNTITRQIGSLKFTQLSKIEVSTARAYLKELADKYNPESIVASTKGTPTELHGVQLRGKMVLVVPKQVEPIPPEIRAYAKLLKIKIMERP